MKKNIIIVALVLIVPLVAFWFLSNSNSTSAKTDMQTKKFAQKLFLVLFLGANLLSN